MPTILVADDNANIQKMVALSFEDRGVEVVSVGNGEAAVRRIPDVKPDVVLADIFMPVRNGYEVCEFVKKDSRFSHVPVILLVGAFDPLDEKEARRVGADGVLKKPFVPPDPLIAMVMSALEKNPKLAAELAKAQANQAPPSREVDSVPRPATSIRSETKPLPSFPEPTPEEEALLYSSGSGHRSPEQPSIGNQAANEPQPPVSEFAPAVEDEFDPGATSRDWRRSAMDVEIPAEAANRPAFVTDDLDSSIFPSERDVPPRRVQEPQPSEEVAPVQLPSQAAPPAETAQVESVLPASTPDADFFAPAESEPLEAEARAANSTPLEPEAAAAFEPAPAPQDRPPHWMDQLAELSSDRGPSKEWMSGLPEQAAPGTIPAGSQAQYEDSTVAALASPDAKPSEPEPHSDRSARVSADAVSTDQQTSEDSFFVDETASSLLRPASYSSAPSAGEPASEPDEETVEPTAIESVPVAFLSEQSLEVDSTPELPVTLQDPNLMQPPAIQVTPEPLLIEEPQAPAQYGSGERQDLQPTYSFFAPPALEPSAQEPSPQASASPLVTEGVLKTQAPQLEISERIPTGPPPNREALAEIPFLTPPPDFRYESREQSAAIPDPHTVDAVVQKVLEKLQPQLQDLLSQGILKPLVENLLQSELAKKNQ